MTDWRADPVRGRWEPRRKTQSVRAVSRGTALPPSGVVLVAEQQLDLFGPITSWTMENAEGLADPFPAWIGHGSFGIVGTLDPIQRCPEVEAAAAEFEKQLVQQRRSRRRHDGSPEGGADGRTVRFNQCCSPDDHVAPDHEINELLF